MKIHPRANISWIAEVTNIYIFNGMIMMPCWFPFESLHRPTSVTKNRSQKAFEILIDSRVQYFEENNVEIEKIVIGQRLGLFLNKYDHKLGEMFRGCTTLPIEFSEDRRTAALGAAWSKACS